MSEAHVVGQAPGSEREFLAVIIADFLSIPIVIDKPAVDRRRAAHERQ